MLRAKPSYRTTREKILVYRADCTTEIMGAILILLSTLLWRQDTEIKSSIGTQGSCRTQNKYSKDATQVKMHKPLYQVNLDMITYTSNLGMFCNFSLISFLLRVLISEKNPLGHFQLVYCLNSIWDIERNGGLIWSLHLSVLLCWKQCSKTRYSDLFLAV